jgi:hypothetical protein
MKLRLALLVALLLSGCAAPPPDSTPVQQAVRPLPLSIVPVYDSRAEVQLAQALVQHYLSGPYYRISAPLLLSQQYQARHAANTSDPQRMLALFSHPQGRWGFVAVSVAQGSVMNLFELQHRGQPGYALVLKRARICFNTGADQPPRWQGRSWVYSPQPGQFECSGQTNGSLFQVGSGLPGALGPYAESGDTVLYSHDRQSLQQIASLLKHQFRHLRVPPIRPDTL